MCFITTHTVINFLRAGGDNNYYLQHSIITQGGRVCVGRCEASCHPAICSTSRCLNRTKCVHNIAKGEHEVGIGPLCCTYLPSHARERARVLGSASDSVLCRRRAFGHTERVLAIPGEICQGLPGKPVVLGAFQQHGGRPRRAEHQDKVSEEELGLQVEPERLLLHPLSRLPPGVRVAEGRVAHGRGRVRLAWHGRVTLAALCDRARLPNARRCRVFVEAELLRQVGTAHRLGAGRPAQGQVAHAWVACSAAAAVLRQEGFGFNVCRENKQAFSLVKLVAWQCSVEGNLSWKDRKCDAAGNVSATPIHVLFERTVMA